LISAPAVLSDAATHAVPESIDNFGFGREFFQNPTGGIKTP